MPRKLSPPACRFSPNVVMRSYSARVAMMEMTTSRIIPQLSKNGSWKLRQPTPQSSSCCR